MSTNALLFLIAFLVNFFTLAHIFAIRKRSEANRAYLSLAFFLAAWTFTNLLFRLPFDDPTIYRIKVMDPFAWIPLGVLFYHFVLKLSYRREPIRFRIYQALIVPAYAINVFTPWIVTHQTATGRVDGPLFLPLVLTVVSIPVLDGLALALRTYRAQQDRELKRQALLVLLGGGIAFCIAVLTDALIPTIAPQWKVPQIGAMTTSIFTLFMYAATIRHSFSSHSVEHSARSIFERMDDAVLLYNAEGVVIQSNEAAGALLGQTRESLAGRPLSALLPGYELTSSAPWEDDFSLRNGGKKPKILSISRTRHQEGGMNLGGVLILRDISLRRWAEGELRRLNEELDERVQTRTRDLRQANDRLTQEIRERQDLQGQLIRSERLAAVGTLAGGVAHEFNNINVSVLGFAELALMNSGLDKETRYYIEKVVRAAKRAKDITHNLLTFSSVVSGRREMSDINHICEESLELARGELEANHVTIRVEYGALPPICVDANQIGQVVLNLLINAGHALLERPVREVVLRTRRDDDHLLVEVEDTGCGIAREDQNRIFTPFYSTKGEHSNGRTPQAHVKGTGLGLSTCQTIVDNHKGSLAVRSEPDKGSTFTLRLPREAEEEKDTVNLPANE
ncbi:MAG: ATP-binding protein, partial [Planctomycetota bacterium]